MIQTNVDGSVDIDLARLIVSGAPVLVQYRGRKWRLVSVGVDTVVTGVEVGRPEDVPVKGEVL